MTTLRNRLIRLAFYKPHTRRDILPLVVKKAAKMKPADKETIDEIKRVLTGAAARYASHFDLQKITVGDYFKTYRKGGHLLVEAYLLDPMTYIMFHFTIQMDGSGSGKIRVITPSIRQRRDVLVAGKRVDRKFSYESIDPSELGNPRAMFGNATVPDYALERV